MATTAPQKLSSRLSAPDTALNTSKPASHTAQDGTTESPRVKSRNLLVILHGKRVDDDLLRGALEDIKQQGHQLTVRVTFDRGDVEHFITEAIRLNDAGVANYQTIVAGGGDGTLNEVVAALMQHRGAISRQGLSVALIPLGTANDFACSTGISVDPHEALRVALDPTLIRPIDVALVNGHPFLNVAVAGGMAEVPADELSSKWKRLLGPVAIAFYVIKRLSSRRVLQPHASATISFQPQRAQHITAEPGHTSRSTTAVAAGNSTNSSSNGNGSKAGGLSAQQQSLSEQQLTPGAVRESTSPPPLLEFQTDLLMLVAGNSRQMGRTLAVCPDALLDDGLLDFTLLTGKSLATQAAALMSALASRDDHESAHGSGICQLRASRLEVTAAATSGNASNSSSSNSNGVEQPSVDVIPVNRDGEPEESSSRLVFEVLPLALPFHLPDDRLLLSGQAAAATASRSSTGRAAAASDASSSALQPPTATAEAPPQFPKGSIKQPGEDKFVSAATALPAGSSKGRSGSGPHNRRRHHRHRALTMRTLRRMLVVAGPEGGGVRRRLKLVAAGRKLCLSLSVVLLGGLLGWAAGSRAAKAQEAQRQRQQEVEAEAQRQQVKKQQKHHKGWLQQASQSVPATAAV